MSKNLDFGILFDFYRNILTEKQREIVDLYYNEDLSLAEISEHMNMTRQGIRSNIKRAEDMMGQMEKNLGLAARYQRISVAVKEISAEIDRIEIDENSVKKLKSLLFQIEEQ